MDVLKVTPSQLITEFLTTQGKEVIRKMFYGFDTAKLVRRFDGVKETLQLAEMDVTKDLIYEWNSTMSMSRTDEAIEITDLKLQTALMKTELKAVVLERNMRAFKAYLKGAGMSDDDMHFVEYLIQASVEKQMQEMEDALWQAVEDTNPANVGNRKLIERFNGYRKIAEDAAVAGKATVVTTGAITDANAVAKVHQLYRSASKIMKNKGFQIFCSYNTFESYQENYSATHQGREKPLEEVKGADYSYNGLKLTLGGGKTTLVPVTGFGDDDALIGTRREFLAYGFDYEGEMGQWDVQKHGWEHWMLNHFPVGVQIMVKKPGFLLVNDRI